ncbi:hypothetical protein BH11MYX4_BH11MYX4_24240 [soil metagenome]
MDPIVGAGCAQVGPIMPPTPTTRSRRWLRDAALAVGLAVVGTVGFACSSSEDDGDTSEAAQTACNSPVPGIRLSPAFPNLQFSIPTTLVRSPDNKTYFVAEKAGTIKSFPNDPNAASATTFLDIRDRVNSGDREPGINGLAVHPSFPRIPEVYVTYNGRADNGGYLWRLSRFTSKDGGKTIDPTTEEIMLSAIKPASEHNGGQVVFHPKEKGSTGAPLLYVSVGDSEAAKGPLGNAQNLNSIFGKFLRIDILNASTRKTKKLTHDAPADNPFGAKGEFPPIVTGATTTPRGLKEIYSWGHRNPWRWTFDQHDGKTDIIAAEVGQESFEEINVVKKAHNYGWNFLEGLHRQQFCKEFGNCAGETLGICNAADGDTCTDRVLTNPITEVPHRADPNDPLTKNAGGYLAQSVTGGFVYRGNNKDLAKLVGLYIYADFQSGAVFASVPNAQFPPGFAVSSGTVTPLKIGGGEMITSFQTEANGEMLALGFHGQVYRLTAGSCPQLPDPNARNYVYLSKQGILSYSEGLDYLLQANPDVDSLASFKVKTELLPKDPAQFKNFAGPDFTLQKFKDQFMQGEIVSALYKNDLDLGFWRQMSCTTNIAPGIGGCAVTNWPATDDPSFDATRGNPVVPDPNGLTDDKDNLGTVTMNISPQGFTRFYIFGAKAPHKVQPFAVLDGEGEKVAPALCTPCHSGTYSGSSDLGSIFREFEPSGLRRHPATTEEQAEKQWFDLNQVMRKANAALKGAAAQPMANGVTPQKAVLDYIQAMYPGAGPPALKASDPRHVPKSFLDNGPSVTPQYKQAKIDLYTKLIGPYCSSCHRLNNTDLDKYDFVQNLAVASGSDVLLHQLIFPINGDPKRFTLPQMPQSQFQQFKLLADREAIGTINAWVAQVHNPRVPQCEVTFTVRTDIGAPGFDPNNEALRILGQTTPPRGVTELGGPDPLSNWKATDPGLDLAQTTSDPGGRFRFTGHASFPQGAAIEFKAVVGKNEAVRFELNGQGNRTFTVPNTTTANVDIDWTN